MFATLLRRWRLSAPLALVSMVSILVGGMALTPASAHHAEPRTYSGNALGLGVVVGDNLTNAGGSFFSCFTGNLPRHSTADLRVTHTNGADFTLMFIPDNGGSPRLVEFASIGPCAAETVSHGGKHASVTSTAQVLNAQLKDGFIDEEAGNNAADNLVDFSEIGGSQTLSDSVKVSCNGEKANTPAVLDASSSGGGGRVEAGPAETNIPFPSGLFNQKIPDLPFGFSGFFNELTSSHSKHSASITLIGVHITGPHGYDAVLGFVHANIKCD